MICKLFICACTVPYTLGGFTQNGVPTLAAAAAAAGCLLVERVQIGDLHCRVCDHLTSNHQLLATLGIWILGWEETTRHQRLMQLGYAA